MEQMNELWSRFAASTDDEERAVLLVRLRKLADQARTEQFSANHRVIEPEAKR